jgi:hypothetical protein
LIATRKGLIGAFLVVGLHKGVVGLSHLLLASGLMHQQTFLLERAMGALDKGVGLSRQLHGLHL